jgi:hypothetical protein
MSQQTETVVKTFTATEALAVFRRVKLTAGSGVAVEYADQADSNAYVGVTQQAAAITTAVPVALKGRGRTYKVTAADSFAVLATLYAAADGKVSDSSSGNVIGTALEAAGADGDVVEAFLDEGSIAGPGPASVIVEDAVGSSIPFLIRATCTAGGAEDEVVTSACPQKCVVIRAWMFARDTNAANVTLKNVAAAFTAATAKGATDDAQVAFNNIHANTGIAAGAAINATFSAAASVEICLLCVPVA